MKYVHQKDWGKNIRARIGLGMAAQSSEAVSEARIREAFDGGEKVSLELECQLARVTLLN